MSVCRPDTPIVEQGILLRELNYRIDSGLASAINLVSAAAVRVEGAEAKRALSDVVELLHGHADVQQALAMPKGKALIAAATYVRMMGSAMRRSLLDRMNIRLALATESLPLESFWTMGRGRHGAPRGAGSGSVMILPRVSAVGSSTASATNSRLSLCRFH